MILTDPYTEWSRSLCAPDDYSTIIRCTENFWSLCTKPLPYPNWYFYWATYRLP